MNPNQTRNIIVAASFFLFVCFFAYYYFLKESEIKGLKRENKNALIERDSIIDHQIFTSQKIQKKRDITIDSLLTYTKTIQTKDSILIYENKRKKNNNRTLNPIQRNAKLDSLFRANSVRP